MNRRVIVAAVAGVLALSGAASASASGSLPASPPLDFTRAGQSEIVDFNGYYPPAPVQPGKGPPPIEVDPALTSKIQITLISITNNGYDWNFAYTATNTSGETSRMAVVGWDFSSATPDIEFDTSGFRVRGADAPFTTWSRGDMWGPIGAREFCLTGGAGCGGEPGDGLTDPNSSGVHSGGGTFTIAFDSEGPRGLHFRAPTDLAFDNIAVGYTSLAGVSVPGFDTTSSGGVGVSAVAVPEPSTWALMMVSLFGLGAVSRRRRALVAAA